MYWLSTSQSNGFAYKLLFALFLFHHQDRMYEFSLALGFLALAYDLLHRVARLSNIAHKISKRMGRSSMSSGLRI